MINLMGAVQIAAAAEGLVIAEQAGLDLDQVRQAIEIGQAASPQVVRNVARMTADQHERDIVFLRPAAASRTRATVCNWRATLVSMPGSGGVAERAYEGTGRDGLWRRQRKQGHGCTAQEAAELNQPHRLKRTTAQASPSTAPRIANGA